MINVNCKVIINIIQMNHSFDFCMYGKIKDYYTTIPDQSLSVYIGTSI